jgi:hypothetical protein
VDSCRQILPSSDDCDRGGVRVGERKQKKKCFPGKNPPPPPTVSEGSTLEKC